MDNNIKVLGYTEELGKMLKHLKNHMPATHQHTKYPGSDDTISGGLGSIGNYYHNGYFSLRVVSLETEDDDGEGGVIAVTKNYFVVCDGGTWNESTKTSSPSRCKWHGSLLDVPCVFSEQDIASLGAEWFAGADDSTTITIRDVRLFVHHLRRTGWIKFMPLDSASYNNNVASCASSFSTMSIGQVAITRAIIPATETLEEGAEPPAPEYVYYGHVVTNMNFPILLLQQIASAGGIENLVLSTDNTEPELTNAYGYDGHYAIVLDIIDHPSNAKFNSTLFTPNGCVRIIKPNYILTGESRRQHIEFYVNNKSFSLPPTYLTLPVASPPSEGGELTSLPVVALKYTRSTLPDTSVTPAIPGLPSDLGFAVYASPAEMRSAISANNAIMLLGVYTITTNTQNGTEGAPAVTTTTYVSDTNTTGNTNVLLYYQCAAE